MINKALITFFIIVLSLFCIKTSLLEKKEITQQNQNTVNLYFNIDNNYVDYFIVTTFSIFKNTKSNIHIYLVEDNISDKNKQRIIDFVEKKHKQKIDIIHFSNYEKLFNSQTYHYLKHISKISFARILVGSLTPQNIDKILYLDADLLVRNDINKLYNTNISNYVVAMAANPGEGSPHGNFNGGVVLINLKEWRKQNIEEKVLKYTQKAYNEIKKTDDNIQPIDQDAYNIILKNQIYPLDQKWNTPSHITYNDIYNHNSKKIRWNDKAYINHYYGSIKPWTLFPFIKQHSLYFLYWIQTGEIKSMLKTFYNGFKKNLQYQRERRNPNLAS